MTNTEKVRLVQEDKMGWREMCGVHKVLVKTNTEKVRTNMEEVRLVQKDWIKALVAGSQIYIVQKDWTKVLVAESLTNKAYFLACISLQFFCIVIDSLSAEMISTFSAMAKQRLHLSLVSQLGIEHRSCRGLWISVRGRHIIFFFIFSKGKQFSMGHSAIDDAFFRKKISATPQVTKRKVVKGR